MRNAKDYIKKSETEGVTTITSLAYWLTPEGLDSPIIAALIRETISNTTDEEFKKMFDGATKSEADHHMKQWELCYMAHWGALELVKAIVLCDTSRDETLALRAINLAQGVEELPEIFPPKTGIEWAMARGYLINRNVCIWCGTNPGTYGHPSNPLSTTNHAITPTTETVVLTSSATNNSYIASLFDPVPVEVLEKMFPANGKWRKWADKAKATGLDCARERRARFNPYRAGVWFIHKGAEGWDYARLNRTLANRLPERSRDQKHLLTGDID